MPRPTPKPNQRSPKQTVQPEVVSPAWLIKAILFTVLAALFCGYLTFCLLFYQGQWQLVLHPARTTSSPQSIAGSPYELIHFGPDESATPQLTGWWIPAMPGGRYARTTILFLPGADGSLADAIPTLASLHNLGLNVFAFDYRGYGQSAATHPSQQNMTQDAESAWRYLNASRGIAPQQIVPYGTGIGASLATHLAAAHPAIPAIILDSPHADLLDQVLSDRRTHLIPVRLLFHEHFPLAQPLSTLPTPKLLLDRTAPPSPTFRSAAEPKFIAELNSSSDALYNQTLTRFLDQYLPSAPVP
jgi:pimeloyl-ACP methyl ester carboxylesterase